MRRLNLVSQMGSIEPAHVSSSARWGLIFLLFCVAIISYVDRGSLSIAAPILVRQFDMRPAAVGWLLSAFFWSYAALQIAAGLLVDRFGAKVVLAAGVAIWSLATFASGFAPGVSTLFIARLVLGAGEAVMFPCFSQSCANAFSPSERALPNAVIDAGTKIGPALGVLVGGLLVSQYGWRVLFLALGCFSLLWIVPWLRAKPIGRQSNLAPAAADAPSQSPKLHDLLRSRDLWGTCVGSCAYTYAYFFLLTWLPTYLVQERGLSLAAMAGLGSAPYFVSAAVAVLAGWASDALIRSGVSATWVRKSALAGGLILSTLALPSAFVPDLKLSLALLSIAYAAFGIFASNLWAVSQTLAGSAAAGKWAGIQNCLGATTGALAAVITGIVLERTGSFHAAFGLTAVLAVIGAISYIFVVGPITEIDWNRRRLS